MSGSRAGEECLRIVVVRHAICIPRTVRFHVGLLSSLPSCTVVQGLGALRVECSVRRRCNCEKDVDVFKAGVREFITSPHLYTAVPLDIIPPSVVCSEGKRIIV